MKMHVDHENALEKVLQSERPLLFVGHGVRLAQAGSLLLSVAEKHEIPIVITSHVKGHIEESHPCMAGIFGFGCRPEVETWIRQYAPDAVLCLGTRLGEASTVGWTPALASIPFKVQVLNEEPWPRQKIKIDQFILGDLRETLNFLLNHDRPSSLPSRSTWLENSPLRQFNRREKKLAKEQLMRSPIHPVDLMRALELVLPENALIISDIGNAMAWAVNELSIDSTQDFYFPLSLGAMGSGIGAAIGAKIAQPKRPIVCLAGDCAMLMHGQEIVTAIQTGVAPVFIVFNDGGHGMVDHGHRIYKMDGIQVRFKNKIAFQPWAEAMGAKGICVSNLQQFIELDWDELLQGEVPVVLDLPIDATIVPPIQSRAKVIGQSLGVEK